MAAVSECRKRSRWDKAAEWDFKVSVFATQTASAHTSKADGQTKTRFAVRRRVALFWAWACLLADCHVLLADKPSCPTLAHHPVAGLGSRLSAILVGLAVVSVTTFLTVAASINTKRKRFDIGERDCCAEASACGWNVQRAYVVLLLSCHAKSCINKGLQAHVLSNHAGFEIRAANFLFPYPI